MIKRIYELVWAWMRRLITGRELSQELGYLLIGLWL